jgi:hypothetical protein
MDYPNRMSKQPNSIAVHPEYGQMNGFAVINVWTVDLFATF